MTVTIFHNPRCSKSRRTLALLQENGIEPEIVEYLSTPPDAAALDAILTLLGREPREVMRKKEDPYKALGLDDPEKTRAELIQAMIANPVLIERPIVINDGKKAALGRPPEQVLEIF